MTLTVTYPAAPLDVVAIGIGPSNLSLGALLHPIEGVTVQLLDRRSQFSWHPGVMFPGVTTQVHWLKDLVSLVDPTSRFSFLAFLASQRRLYRAVIAGRDHVPRREFEEYYRWVAAQLPRLAFGVSVASVDHTGELFEVKTSHGVLHTRHVVVGVGLRPRVPPFVQPLVDGETVFHAAATAERARRFAGRRVAVAGGGQSGAEIVQHLLRDGAALPERVVWASKRPNFAPLDDSPFTNEFFTPGYSRHFHALAEPRRAELLQQQRLASDGISLDLLQDLYRRLYDLEFIDGAGRRCELLPDTRLVDAERLRDRIRLTWQSGDTAVRWDDTVDVLVCATGYEHGLPEVLEPLSYRIARDARELPVVREDFSLAWDGPSDQRIYVQNAAQHAFGIADPNLSLTAWRAATIVNSVTGRTHYDTGEASGAIRWSVARSEPARSAEEGWGTP